MSKELTESDKKYWNTNLTLIIICLSIWAFVSYGLGIVFRPFLMGITFAGMDIGFWFAEQGSIYTFLVLIFFYSWKMNALDKEYGLED